MVPTKTYDAGRVALSAPSLTERFAARTTEVAAPSTVWAVIAGGQVVAHGGSAVEAVTPVPSLDTAYRIASCTKSFTAAALMQLRDAGEVGLDQPVSELLPLTVLPEGPAPTLGQLASMSAGFPTDDPWADREESMATEDLDALARGGFRLAHRPGERFEYSNLGFVLLGRALERVSGRSYRDLVRERLLEPLGLTGIGFDRDVPGATAAVEGYHRVDGAWQVQPWTGPGAFSPMAGVVATPRALAGWVTWLAEAWNPAAGDAVLSAASRRELQSAVTPIPGDEQLAYGYGLIVRQDQVHGPVVSHSGGYPGFSSHMRWHPSSGIGIVACENARYSNVAAPATEALTDLLDAAAVPSELPQVWPETLSARATIESLIRQWDEPAARALFADNVAADDPLPRRAQHLAQLAAQIGLEPEAPVADLIDAAAQSDSPAHLIWRVRGRTGALRCEIRLTPERAPRVQTLTVRLG